MSTPPSISNTELEVLKALWSDRSASVRQVHENLKAAGKTWAYNTVQTLLNRLSWKGFVKAERDGRAVEYTVVATRDDLVRQQLDGIADTICEGSPTPLVQCLFQGRKFSRDEIEDFRKLLDDLESDAQGDASADGAEERS
jgi:predicted transcriptional regulator